MFTVIIPARYASSRLPGKPLADIAGKPMVQHVYEQAQQSEARQVVIATDDQRIQQAAAGFGAHCILTRADHKTGTDRLHEAALQLGLQADAVVVNVQGDEPLIPPDNINQVYRNIIASGADIATLSVPISSDEEYTDPNAVKVVAAHNGAALYFSRAPIPYKREGMLAPAAFTPQRHVGLYAYKVSLLEQFVSWPPGELEQAEKLEQLRALQQGATIHVAVAAVKPPAGVDTPADLARLNTPAWPLTPPV